MMMGHQWTKGARILDAQLSTCSGPCGTLRVEHDSGKTRYIRPIYDPGLRILAEEPPCVNVRRTRGGPPE
jgi:hypothetical protein